MKEIASKLKSESAADDGDSAVDSLSVSQLYLRLMLPPVQM